MRRCRRRQSPPRADTSSARSPQHLVPGDAALGRGYRHALCEIQEVGRAGDERVIPLDAERDLIPFGDAKSVSDCLRRGDLARADLEAPWAARDSTEASTLIVDVVTLPGTTPTVGNRVVWMRAPAKGQ
jgi:hypothetical protein